MTALEQWQRDSRTELSAADLTPVELRGGLWLKREDLYRLPNGVNGAKLRACQYLLADAKKRGYTGVISAASVLSPQSAMASTLAADLGLSMTIVVGGTTAALASRHTSIRTALAASPAAEVVAIGVGYNPALQSAARQIARNDPQLYHLQYGITPQPGASLDLIRGFHETAAGQVANLPDQVETLVLPFGSGNTGAGVLYGLAREPHNVRRVVLAAIGPSRVAWLYERLALLGVGRLLPFTVEVEDLHGSGFARYGDRMPATHHGVVLHPTYEGKVWRYLDQAQPDYWTRRDGSTLVWIVGGPLARAAGAAS